MASVSGDARDSASSFRTNALTLCCLEDVDRLWECTQSRIRNITNTATYSVDDAERLCDRLNAKLGLSRDAWTALAAASMRVELPEPDDDPVH